MAKRPLLPLHDVRALSIREIVHLWRREADFHPRTLERELRRYHSNGRLDWQEGERIDPMTPDEDLPPPHTLMSREALKLFCTKKEWEPPKFWFPPDPAEKGLPGRPSSKSATVQEYKNRAERGETLATIADEARAIHAALESRGVAEVPQAKTVQNHIRRLFKARKPTP